MTAQQLTSASRSRTYVWVALLGLTFVSFAAGDRLARAALVPIMIAAALKSSMVGFEFMELRRAHPLWRAAFATLIGAIVVALFVAQRAA